MPIKTVHHMLLGMSETIMCTTCKEHKGYMSDMYIVTRDFPGWESSEVTETLCERCHRKVKR